MNTGITKKDLVVRNIALTIYYTYGIVEDIQQTTNSRIHGYGGGSYRDDDGNFQLREIEIDTEVEQKTEVFYRDVASGTENHLTLYDNNSLPIRRTNEIIYLRADYKDGYWHEFALANYTLKKYKSLTSVNELYPYFSKQLNLKTKLRATSLLIVAGSSAFTITANNFGFILFEPGVDVIVALITGGMASYAISVIVKTILRNSISKALKDFKI